MKVILKEDDEAYHFLKMEIKQIVKDALKEMASEAQRTDRGEQQEQEDWCDSKRAMQILGVKKTKMQEIRDNVPYNGIQMSRDGRTFRYYVPSLYAYLKNHLIR